VTDELHEGDGVTPEVEGDPAPPEATEAPAVEDMTAEDIAAVGTPEDEPVAEPVETVDLSHLPSADEAMKLAAETPGVPVPASDGKRYWA
jgi:hypothetical protein